LSHFLGLSSSIRNSGPGPGHEDAREYAVSGERIAVRRRRGDAMATVRTSFVQIGPQGTSARNSRPCDGAAACRGKFKQEKSD
jgi:hypothetical protein